MKKILYTASLVVAAMTIFSGCKKFEEINTNPLAASEDQVQPEYFINNSIVGAQQDPHIAERVFVLYWKTGGNQHRTNSINIGTYDDGWSSDYWGYLNGWLNSINSGVQNAQLKLEKGTGNAYTNNLLQVSRIWRAYLMSEAADNFGPIAINGFQGVNPDFASIKDVYYFLLDELKDASTKMDVALTPDDVLKKTDPAYQYDFARWQRYANSMRLRLAMRLSEVDAAKAKTEFEAAASGNLITEMAHTFQVTERPGWDPLTGVMSREWNDQLMSATLKNLFNGLGGVSSESQLTDAAMKANIKEADWLGVKYDKHFSSLTNDPTAGFWFDGLPKTVDPRAYKAFPIPGDLNNPQFNKYPSWDVTYATNTKRPLINPDGTDTLVLIDAKYTWNAFPSGDWGAKGSKNGIRTYKGAIPNLAHRFRSSENKRIFFAPWETYFLIAEAAVRGWSVPMGGKEAYEKGIAANFEYFGVSSFLTPYLASNDYNNAGTSVNWDHTAEPPASRTMRFKDGYSGAAGTKAVLYPVNNIYKGGAVKNDLMNKILTQKYIANLPWLPLEAWSDHRRTGLPFFENPVFENPLPNMPQLTQANYMTNQWNFFPGRLKYPSSLGRNTPESYQQAVSLLGSGDEIWSPLWWAGK